LGGGKALKGGEEKSPEGFFGAAFFALPPQIIEHLKESK